MPPLSDKRVSSRKALVGKYRAMYLEVGSDRSDRSEADLSHLDRTEHQAGNNEDDQIQRRGAHKDAPGDKE